MVSLESRKYFLGIKLFNHETCIEANQKMAFAKLATVTVISCKVELQFVGLYNIAYSVFSGNVVAKLVVFAVKCHVK